MTAVCRSLLLGIWLLYENISDGCGVAKSSLQLCPHILQGDHRISVLCPAVIVLYFLFIPFRIAPEVVYLHFQGHICILDHGFECVFFSGVQKSYILREYLRVTL